MKIVDATWEERNLGVPCREVTVETGDRFEAAVAEIAALPDGYQVVKVPVAQYDVMSALEGLGFSFIEASIRVGHDLVLNDPVGLFGRMLQATECVVLDAEGVAAVAEEILRGIFTTDRVYLDPHFTSECAAQRYVNWMYDEIERGASIHEFYMSGRAAGFFVFRQDAEGTGYSVLSGLYETGRSPGLGGLLLYSVLAEGARRRLRRLSSHISTNNLAVVKTHVEQGFSFLDVHYVYTRLTGQ